MSTWQNWAGNQTMSPASVLHPRSTDEIATAVKDAASAGRRVKAIGSGHSFTSIGLTDGVQLQLDRHDRLLSVDQDAMQVTVESGMQLHALNTLLTAHDLGLTNMGDIDVQTVSGAISTGTHGTGRASGAISAQVVGLELVLADGSVVTCSRDERPDLFEMARVGLGALGVISAVTFQAEKAFALHADERPMPLDDVLDGFEELVADNEHFEFYWFPHTRLALTKRNNRTTSLEPLSRRRAWIDDELLSNGLFEVTNRLCARAPRIIPRVNKIAARALSAREYSDVAPLVFTSPRRVRFCEMEYAVPRADLPAVFRELSTLPEKIGEVISFPVECRVAPADDIPLSTASGRDSAYIAVHVYKGTRFDRYFDAVESLMGTVGGRPHWGKLHGLSSVELAERYPRFEEFRALRSAVDPEGRFRNDYLDKVLGAP
ncbi:MAG: FAD-dependent oxidoreductase [Frankiales bacterium]|nr:FAD-dependent oxidoreductase [Frankiales bacterium]